VISDDMQMGAIREFYTFEESIRKAIEAGLDILAIANNSIYDDTVMQRGVDVVRGLVTDGVVSVARIEESAARIQTLKQRLADNR
ncbi:MAG: glycoside hydrolase family 3, partial [Caldilineaceae bacterium]|nr:glycoside hydrolase family 3 [Caldilineaceae bacterium]